jgi:DNA-binding response OmpR family regulator
VRILVADDDDFFLALITDVLGRAGYEVFQARSGSEALRKVVQFRPALVILDVVMPGMAGTEVSEKLRDYSRTASIPVLLISAFARGSGPSSAAEYLADDFLQKPVDPEELLKRIETLLQKSSKFSSLGEGRPPMPAPYRPVDDGETREALDHLPAQIEEAITALEEGDCDDVLFDEEEEAED